MSHLEIMSEYVPGRLRGGRSQFHWRAGVLDFPWRAGCWRAGFFYEREKKFPWIFPGALNFPWIFPGMLDPFSLDFPWIFPGFSRSYGAGFSLDFFLFLLARWIFPGFPPARQ